MEKYPHGDSDPQPDIHANRPDEVPTEGDPAPQTESPGKHEQSEISPIIPRLRWGLPSAVPAEAIGAWGCRAIVNVDNTVDLVPDRIDQQGSRVIFERVDNLYPVPTMREQIAEKLRSGHMLNQFQGQVTLYESDLLTVVADTRGSFGYCYVAAWTTAPGPDGD